MGHYRSEMGYEGQDAEDVMKVAEGIAGCIPPRVQKVNREFAAIVIARTILTDRAAQAERMARLEEALTLPTADELASTVANIRQGHSSTPRCESPGEADIQVAKTWTGYVLKALASRAAIRALSQEGSEPS